MSRAPAPREVAVGLALKLMLDRLGRDSGRRAVTPARTAGGSPGVRRPSAGRRGLRLTMVSSFVVGLVLMVGFEAPVTRIVGVLALFTFIVSGVFLIADPAFLGQEEDRDSLTPPGSG